MTDTYDAAARWRGEGASADEAGALARVADPAHGIEPAAVIAAYRAGLADGVAADDPSHDSDVAHCPRCGLDDSTAQIIPGEDPRTVLVCQCGATYGGRWTS